MVKEAALPENPDDKPEESSPGRPDLYKIVEPLTGEFTIVTKEEMRLIHDLLTIVKS